MVEVTGKGFRADSGGATEGMEIAAIEPSMPDSQSPVPEQSTGVVGEAGKSNRPPDGDPDDEEDVCRICRTPGDDDSPLYYPCACSGSIKYVHQECLLQWLNHSNARQCEVCYFCNQYFLSHVKGF